MPALGTLANKPCIVAKSKSMSIHAEHREALHFCHFCVREHMCACSFSLAHTNHSTKVLAQLGLSVRLSVWVRITKCMSVLALASQSSSDADLHAVPSMSVCMAVFACVCLSVCQ